MSTLEFETTLAAPIDTVWAFFQNPQNLIRLTPPQQQPRIESADEPLKVGSKIVLSLRLPLCGRERWVVRIVQHRPPHPVVFGQEARFVDEQESGPFSRWVHEHDLEAADSKTTRIVDRVKYRLPFGPLGWVADALFVRRQVRSMFEYRRRLLPELLAGGSDASG